MTDPLSQPSGEGTGRAGSPEAYRFPGYRITANLRRTRAGHWFRARQERIGRDVLIKVAPRGDARAGEELEREVGLLGRVRSPNLITLYDFRSESSVPYAVYELPGERTLDRAVEDAGGSLPLLEAAAAGRQIAEAIQALHRSGIWLRQAAPQDFYIDGSGRIRLASLEGAEPGGAPPQERSPLWLAPGEPGPAGDLFLLGLLLIYLLSGKVPAPHGVVELPGRWIDLVSRRLAARPQTQRSGGKNGPSPSEAAMSLVRRLIAAPGSSPAPQVERAIAALAALEEGEGRDLPLVPSRRWNPALPAAAAAALLGLLIGAWAWKAMTPGRLPADPEVAPAAVGGADSGEPDVPAAAGRPAPEAAQPASTPVVEAEPAPAPAPGSPNPTGGGEEPAGPSAPPAPGSTTVPAPPPIPLIVPAPPPSPVELFLARAHRDLKRVPPPREEELEALWMDGVQLARGQPVEVEGRELSEVLLRIGGDLEERSLRRTLLAGEVLELDRERFRVRYDFSSRRQLRDWTAAGAGSRVAVLEGRLVTLGKVVFSPGRYLRDRVRMQWVIPAGGRHPLRPNINVILWAPEGKGADFEAEPPPPPVLFGIGAYFGGGVIHLSEGHPGEVRLPATVVIALAGADPGDGAALWAAAPGGPKSPEAEAERFELEWTAGGIRWLRGGGAVLPEPIPAPILEGLQPLAGRRGTVAWFTADSPLEIEEIILEGALDADRLRSEALEAAAARLRAALEKS